MGAARLIKRPLDLWKDNYRALLVLLGELDFPRKRPRYPMPVKYGSRMFVIRHLKSPLPV